MNKSRERKVELMVVLRDLWKSYKGFPVLKGLDMTINRGDVYGFVGKNGCGKTTTMNILCDIIPKDRGEVTLGGGEPIKIGYLPESPSLYTYMNAYEYLDYIAACCLYEGDKNRRIAEVIHIVNLGEGAKRRIKGYSRGMIQRLGIAAAIFNNPDLLILDEPTSALDPMGRAEVMGVIEDLCKSGTTILLCTHILSDIERVANRVGLLVDGRMAVEGTLAEVLAYYSTSDSLVLKLYPEDMEVAEKIKAIDCIESFLITPKTDEIVIKSGDMKALSRQIVQLLAENGTAIESMAIRKNSLEDIYLQLQGTNSGRIGGQGNAN